MAFIVADSFLMFLYFHNFRKIYYTLTSHVVIVRRHCGVNCGGGTNRNRCPLHALKPKPNSTYITSKNQSYEMVRSVFICGHAHSPQIAVQASRVPQNLHTILQCKKGTLQLPGHKISSTAWVLSLFLWTQIRFSRPNTLKPKHKSVRFSSQRRTLLRAHGLSYVFTKKIQVEIYSLNMSRFWDTSRLLNFTWTHSLKHRVTTSSEIIRINSR